MHLLNYQIEHRAEYPWQFVVGKRCMLRLRCNESVRSINVVFGDPFWFIDGDKLRPKLHALPVTEKKTLLDDTFYTVSLEMETHKLRYHFEIILEDGTELYLSETGITEPVSEEVLRPFMVPYVFPDEHFSAPEWAKNTVWYQIFPDRFSRGGEGETPFIPTRENRFGGTLKGIERNIPHLKALGVQGIYLNPIFESPSNHRYDTADYSLIDPMLGTERDFASLVSALHENGLRIMLDGVYNHTSWDHPYWQDVLKNGENSEYFHWFYIENLNALRGRTLNDLTADYMRESKPYESFAFAANMPKWNTENPDVQDYLSGIAAEWTSKYGLDAWRLDVPDEVSSRFLEKFKKSIRKANPQAYIIGEIWQQPSQWLCSGTFDGTMDYPLYFAIRDFAMTGKDPTETFAARVKARLLSVPTCARPYQFAFCGNHDIPRVLTVCGGDMERLSLSVFLQMLFGGTANIYYGDELGMTGGEDPLNRGAMAWEMHNKDVSQLYSSMIELKKDRLKDLIITGISVKDHVLAVTLTGRGEYMAYVTEPGRKIRLTLPDNMHPIAGDASLAQGYALFEKK